MKGEPNSSKEGIERSSLVMRLVWKGIRFKGLYQYDAGFLFQLFITNLLWTLNKCGEFN